MADKSILRRILSPVVIASTLGFAVLGALFAYGWWAAYQSRAMVSFPHSITEFRVQEERVNSLDNFDRYWAPDKLMEGLDRERIRGLIASSQQWMKPVLRLSKKDAKDTGKTSNSDLLAYELIASSKDPKTAQKTVEFLAAYVPDASLKINLDNFITTALAEKRLLFTNAALERDNANYKLSLLDARLEDLRRIVKTYPTAAGSSERQILNVEKNSERYMPLPMQMIAIEQERFEQQESLGEIRRRVEGFSEEEDMLLAHEQIAKNTNSGKELALTLIKDVKARLPKTQKPYAINALLDYETRYSTMLSDAFSPSGMIVAPTFPEKPSKSRLLTTLMFGFAGLLLGLLWQFRQDIAYFVKLSFQGETPRS